MVADLQRAAALAQDVLTGPEDNRPDALFDLITLFERIDPNSREDVAEAAQEQIYSLTPHYKRAFQERRRA